MAKNYMKEVANLLGLELEEEFWLFNKELNRKYRSKFKITKDGLKQFYFNGIEWEKSNSFVWEDLLLGKDVIKKPILNQKEEKYLSNVVEPFRDKVVHIQKHCNDVGNGWITIFIKDDTCMYFPSFKADTMYKGMEIDKVYSLKELGL